MRITDTVQVQGTVNVIAGQKSIASVQTEAELKKETAVKLQEAENGASVTISAEGLGLSQGSVVQKDSMQEANEKKLYQEMLENANENAEAQKESFEDMAKALEIARRILDGDIVPREDEQFLMEYDSELYMRVKSMARPKDNPKEYESLLEDEEEEQESPEGQEGQEQQMKVVQA